MCNYIQTISFRYKREIRNKARNKRNGNGPQQFNASRLLPKAGDYSLKVFTSLIWIKTQNIELNTKIIFKKLVPQFIILCININFFSRQCFQTRKAPVEVQTEATDQWQLVRSARRQLSGPGRSWKQDVACYCKWDAH